VIGVLVTAFHVAVADFVVVVGGDVVEGDMINVTGTVYEHQLPTLIVVVALRVPAESPLILTEAAIVLLVVMEVLVGDSTSQVALSEAVSVAVLEEFLETVIVWFAGFTLPYSA